MHETRSRSTLCCGHREDGWIAGSVSRESVSADSLHFKVCRMFSRLHLLPGVAGPCLFAGVQAGQRTFASQGKSLALLIALACFTLQGCGFDAE